MISNVVNVFLNNQIVLAAGTFSPKDKPRKRWKLILSVIWYSVWSSERLNNLCNTSTLNIMTLSNGCRPFCVFSIIPCFAETCKNWGGFLEVPKIYIERGLQMISVGIDTSKGKSTVCVLKPGALRFLCFFSLFLSSICQNALLDFPLMTVFWQTAAADKISAAV